MKRVAAIFTMFALMFFAAQVRGEESGVPGFLFFQSSLYDDGGNPLEDGPVNLLLRILDEEGGVLYEENQFPDVFMGEVSVILGNGLSKDGAPTGGVPSSALAPDGIRYLQAEVEGFPPTPPMEIASVPYAIYANEARSVAAGGVRFASLAEGFVGDLLDALSGDDGGAGEVIVREDLYDMYSDRGSASLIGASPDFAYSSSDNVQAVLSDFDMAIKARHDEITAESAARSEGDASLSSALSAESHARSQGDSSLSTTITAEATARSQGDASLSSALSAEVAARKAADLALGQRIDNIDPALNPPARPQYHLNAWGHVGSCVSTPPVASCANASVAPQPLSHCRVTFETPMPDAAYTVVVTPSMSVSVRDEGGFSVSCGTVPHCSFDFVVVGR